jgi:hypothetical protein
VLSWLRYRIQRRTMVQHTTARWCCRGVRRGIAEHSIAYVAAHSKMRVRWSRGRLGSLKMPALTCSGGGTGGGRVR